MTGHAPERDEAYVAYAETIPVYFAFSESLRLVKIGFSTNIRQRLASIPSDRRAAGPMCLIGWLPGGPRVEAELHDRFASHAEKGEWFYPAPDMADFLDEEGETDEPPVLSNGPFQVSSRGYWAARRRLALAESVERVVHDFGGGRTFRTRELVIDVSIPASVAGLPGVASRSAGAA